MTPERKVRVVELITHEPGAEPVREERTEDIHGPIELFNLLHRQSVVQVEMIWDRVLGDKHQVFKSTKEQANA